MKNAYSKKYLHEQTITIQNNTNEINFEILPSGPQINELLTYGI